MTQDEIIASNLSEIEKANERIKMLEDKLAAIKQAIKELESQEPVAMYREKCADGKRCLHGCHTNEPCYTHPTQSTWVGLTGEMLLKAAQSSLAPEQYDHFEAMSKHQPDIYDRLAYAIRVQDE